MTMPWTLVENLKVVELIPPQVGAGAPVTSDYISLKNAHKAWFVIHYGDGNGNALVLQPLKATAVAPTNSTAFVAGNEVKIWSNLSTATNDRLVERTAATSYTLNAAAANKIIVFEIDPASLGDLAGVPYDVIAVSATSPAAGEYLGAVAYLAPRYASCVATSPTALTD